MIATPVTGGSGVIQIALRVGGERKRVEIEEALEIVDRFEKIISDSKSSTVGVASDSSGGTCNTVVHVTEIDLSGRAWPYDSLFLLDKFFDQYCTNVQVLKIDDIIASLLTDEGLQCMEYIAKKFSCMNIEVIDLSDNAFGSRGVEVLEPLLGLRSLKRLYLNNCGLSAEVGISLLKILLHEPLPSSSTNVGDLEVVSVPEPNLVALALNRNQMGKMGGFAIQKLLAASRAMEYFSYAGCRPRKDGTAAICLGLSEMANFHYNTGFSICPLTYLNLDDCEINSGEDDDDDEHAIHALCNALEKCPALTTLILRDGFLKASGLKRICNALLVSKANLEYFDVGGNEIGVEGSEILSNYLQESAKVAPSQLQTLVCDANELENEGVDVLIQACFKYCRKIKGLYLQCNEITEISMFLNVESDVPDSLVGIDLSDNLSDENGLTKKKISRLQFVYPDVDIVHDEELPDGDDEDQDDDDDDDVNDLLEGFSQSQI